MRFKWWPFGKKRKQYREDLKFFLSRIKIGIENNNHLTVINALYQYYDKGYDFWYRDTLNRRSYTLKVKEYEINLTQLDDKSYQIFIDYDGKTYKHFKIFNYYSRSMDKWFMENIHLEIMYKKLKGEQDEMDKKYFQN